MPHKREDFTGQRFGRLTVLGDGPYRKHSGKNVRYLRCRCDCGIEKDVRRQSLVDGRTQSCGCFNLEKFQERTTNQVPDQDLTGRTFGRLLVLSRDDSSRSAKQSYWICRCDCGKVKSIQRAALVTGRTVSCGCFAKEAAAKANTTHGLHRAPEYYIWNSARDRCRNPNNPGYPDYGGRGIQMCDRWANSFEAFYADMGPRPSPELSIDRIENDGNYEPGNCRWATKEEQMLNRRSTNGMSEVGVMRDNIARVGRERDMSIEEVAALRAENERLKFKLNVTDEWLAKWAAAEEGHSVTAGGDFAPMPKRNSDH
jgi:hypothetical protein